MVRTNVITLFASSIGFLGMVVPVAVFGQDSSEQYVPNEVIIQLKSVSGTLTEPITVAVPDVPGAIEQLQQYSTVATVEPNWIRRISLQPNDPLYNDGENPEYHYFLEQASDIDIDAETAWDITTGSRSIVVAVIDTGVDLNHPDLEDNIWVNTGEIAENGIDDDNNGYIDDVYGWDFVQEDNDASPDLSDSNNFSSSTHGTHVAGTIGAVGNNGTGLTGVNWEVSIMPLRAFGANGLSTTSDIVAAINYARLNGADVINMSFGSGDSSTVEQQAVERATTAGVLSVAALGNENEEIDQLANPMYPACYDDVIGVGATNSTDSKASFSNYGTDCGDIAAPGTLILSTYATADDSADYGYSSGTSMATPLVAGTAALVLSIDSTLEPADLNTLISDSGDTIADFQLNTNRLNAGSAVAALDEYQLPQAAIITAYKQSNLSTTISENTRITETTPVFTWELSRTPSQGLAGYYVAWNVDRVNPVTEGTFQTVASFAPPKIQGNDVTRYLRVVTEDGDGNRSDAAEFVYRVDTKVKKPRLRGVKVVDTGIQIRWRKVKNEHVQKYQIYRAKGKRNKFKKIKKRVNPRKTKFVDRTAQLGVKYRYKVRAVDDLGNKSKLSKASKKKQR